MTEHQPAEQPEEETKIEPQPEPRPTKRGWRIPISSRSMVSLAALFVSACSLVATIMQMRSNREAQYASVLPYLTCGFSKGGYDQSDSTGYFKMTIANDGVGPGFIHWIKIKVGDHIYEGNDYAKAMRDLGHLKESEVVDFTYSSVPSMRLIPAGDELEWFEPVGDNKYIGNIVRNAWINPEGRPFDMYLCFSDVYGRTWLFQYADYKVTPCDGCPEISATSR